MSHFKKRSMLVSDTCPVCRRRFEDMTVADGTTRHLSIEIGNEYFELRFTGHVCQACYCKLAGTRQQSLFDMAGDTLATGYETRQ